jgi:hypothetical protein
MNTNKDLESVPTVETSKGIFFVRNFVNVDPDEIGIDLYDETGEFVTEIKGIHLDEEDEVSKEEVIMTIEDNEEI